MADWPAERGSLTDWLQVAGLSSISLADIARRNLSCAPRRGNWSCFPTGLGGGGRWPVGLDSHEDNPVEELEVAGDGLSSFAKISSQDLGVGIADGCVCKVSSNGKLSSSLRTQDSLRLLSQLSIVAR